MKPLDGPSLIPPPELPNENGEKAPLSEGVGAPEEAMRCAHGLAADGRFEGDDAEAADAVAKGPLPLDASDQGPWNESNGLADEDEATEGVGAGRFRLKPCLADEGDGRWPGRSAGGGGGRVELLGEARSKACPLRSMLAIGGECDLKRPLVMCC